MNRQFIEEKMANQQQQNFGLTTDSRRNEN